jgi:hypothetical protein
MLATGSSSTLRTFIGQQCKLLTSGEYTFLFPSSLHKFGRALQGKKWNSPDESEANPPAIDLSRSSTYGRVLLAKVIVFGMMVGIGAVNLWKINLRFRYSLPGTRNVASTLLLTCLWKPVWLASS